MLIPGQTVSHAHFFPADTLAEVPFAVQTWAALKEGAEFCDNSTTPNTIPSLYGRHLASSPLKTPTPSPSSRPFRRRGLLVARTEPLPLRPFGSHAVAHSHLFMLAGPARSPWPRAPLARAARPTACLLRNRVEVYEQGLRASRCYVWNIHGPHGRRTGAGLKHARPVDIDEAGLGSRYRGNGPGYRV